MSAAPRTPQAIPRRPQLVSSEATPQAGTEDRSIGEIIRQAKNLTEDQLLEIAEHQRKHGVRFGEAAVAMGLATDSDIVFALSQQFHYPFAPDNRRDLHPELVVATQPFSKQAEAFRAIRTQLMLGVLGPNEPKRAISVLSTDHGDGKTYFAANLAIVLAQLGGKTLVMDANMRSPRLHQLFGLPNTSGLSGILSGRQDDSVIYQAPDIPSLFVMPVGVTPPNPLELLERPAFRLLVAELLRKFDHVVVDTPAAQTGTDAHVIAARCGAALVIARRNETRASALHGLCATISTSTAKLAGAVFNDI